MTASESTGALDRLRAIFLAYAEHEVIDRAPLYVPICLGVAGDPDLLAIAAEAQPGQPAPNLLLAAVHYLLLGGASDPLAAFYPDLTAAPRPCAEVYPFFRAFTLSKREAIVELVRTRLVQTSQVRRCAGLLPAVALVYERAGRLPLALVEVGPSAGLNLLLDRYAYLYSDGSSVGGPAALTLRCGLRGEIRPPLPATIPPIASRVGLDLNPIDVRDDEATRWLRALIWPGEEGRAHDLEVALTIARADPPELIRGDALATLPAALGRVSESATPLVYHSFVLNQFPREARQQFDTLLREASRQRPIYRLAMEATARDHSNAILQLFSYRDGAARGETLAIVDAHGAWLAWGDGA
jgi:hypothetical protein